MTNTITVLIGVFSLSFISPIKAFNFTLAGKCSCPMKIEPVCGSVAGVHYTFMNKCIFNCTQSSTNGEPEVLYHYDGVCCRLEHCKPYESPVCDQHGRVYASKCLFDQAQCVELKQKRQHLKLDMNSPNCRCIKQCPLEISMPASSPVCDTNGFTHSNLCSFLNAKCIAKTVHKTTLDIDYMGTCCENLCTSSYSSLPICDSENNTHANLCSFLKYRCERTKRYGKKSTSIGFKFFGTCKVEANTPHFLNVNNNQI